MLPENVVPGELNLIIYQGATFSRTFQFLDDNDAVIDLTGCTGAGKIRKSFSATDPVIPFTVTVTSNTVKISLTSTQTAALENSSEQGRLVRLGYWDLELTYSGRVERMHEGVVNLSREATK